jgi:hypothetical protein
VSPERGTGLATMSELSDREVIESMSNDTKADTQRALYALLAGAEGCGPAARSARLAQDDELADFLLRVQGRSSGKPRGCSPSARPSRDTPIEMPKRSTSRSTPT